MASILGSLWRRLVRAIHSPRYQSPFFVFTQVQLARAYYVAAELKIAELVNERPRASSNWPRRPVVTPRRSIACCDCWPRSACLPKTRQANSASPTARLLLADAPGSIRQWILFEGQSELWQGYAHSLEAVKTGVPAFELATGKTFYQCIAERPSFARAFYGALATWADPKCQAILNAYDFGRFQTVVDVGGGEGRLISHLLRAYPRLRGTVYDLEKTIGKPRAAHAGTPSAERCEFVAGSFFDAIPEGADLYILSDVLGDWDDDAVATILTNCRQAMKPEAVLLIADTLINPRDGADRVSKLLDVERGSFFRSGKRTRAQFEALLARVDLAAVAVHPTTVVDQQLLEVRGGQGAPRVPPVSQLAGQPS